MGYSQRVRHHLCLFFFHLRVEQLFPIPPGDSRGWIAASYSAVEGEVVALHVGGVGECRVCPEVHATPVDAPVADSDSLDDENIPGAIEELLNLDTVSWERVDL
ncbi:hypothetical protein E2C01_049794 [Portunus trituberculatus]|uniref:Uncharacterized protein n=1 Tax=Portunus trituberculatus TaxID=210409 RepID=A0A5B7GFA2_PORTR|nr:hypothetical protein [Portunus trituberculatus]